MFNALLCFLDLRLKEMGLHKVRPWRLRAIEGRETLLAGWCWRSIPSWPRNLGSLGENSGEAIVPPISRRMLREFAFCISVPRKLNIKVSEIKKIRTEKKWCNLEGSGRCLTITDFCFFLSLGWYFLSIYYFVSDSLALKRSSRSKLSQSCFRFAHAQKPT